MRGTYIQCLCKRLTSAAAAISHAEIAGSSRILIQMPCTVVLNTVLGNPAWPNYGLATFTQSIFFLPLFLSLTLVQKIFLGGAQDFFGNSGPVL